jgi:uncharacterized protein YkwD
MQLSPAALSLLAACLCACLSGCASTLPRGSSTSSGEGSFLAYSTRETRPGVVGDGLDGSLEEVIRRTCTSRGLALDGRLARLAEAVARASELGRRAPSFSEVEHHARSAGLIEPTPETWLAAAASPRELEGPVRAAIEEATRNGSRLTHCGAAALREGGGIVLAVALSSRLLSLSRDVPTSVALDESLRIQGQLARKVRDPTLAITDPSGRVTRAALPPGRRVDHRLTFPDPGIYSVELLATGDAGVTVVANFPVAVGVAHAPVAPAASDGPVERDTDEVSERLFALIRRERAQHDLPALRIDRRLVDVALAHSRDMQEHDFIAHTSKRTGEAQDRIVAAGLSATVVLENIGRGYSAGEIHAGLMASPGHRSNILSPDVRELGIGVVSEPEGDRLAFLATQIFTKLSREVPAGQGPKIVAEVVAELRKQKGLPRVTLDPGLSRAAQRAAERFAKKPSLDQEKLLSQAVSEVKKPPKGAKGVGAGLTLAADVEQIGESKRVLEREIRWLGIGVAHQKALGASPWIIVLVYATTQ